MIIEADAEYNQVLLSWLHAPCDVGFKSITKWPQTSFVEQQSKRWEETLKPQAASAEYLSSGAFRGSISGKPPDTLMQIKKKKKQSVDSLRLKSWSE